MTLPTADHPLWSLIRLAIVNGSILLALLLTRTKWDGETLVLITALSATGGMELWARKGMRTAG